MGDELWAVKVPTLHTPSSHGHAECDGSIHTYSSSGGVIYSNQRVLVANSSYQERAPGTHSDLVLKVEACRHSHRY